MRRRAGQLFASERADCSPPDTPRPEPQAQGHPQARGLSREGRLTSKALRQACQRALRIRPGRSVMTTRPRATSTRLRSTNVPSN